MLSRSSASALRYDGTVRSAALVLVLWSGAAFAQAPLVAGCPADAPVFTIPVRVLTPEFNVWEGLSVASFTLSGDGVALALCGMIHVREAVSVGILLDTSTSMRANAFHDPIGQARAFVNRFLDVSGPQDEFFLEYVNSTPKVQCPFGSALPLVRAGLDVTPKGKTALIDALYLALNQMRNARNASRALLVLSDGFENVSVYNDKELSRLVAESPVPIFPLLPALPYPIHGLGPKEIAARDDLMRLAAASGGFYSVIPRDKTSPEAAEQLATAIHLPYRLYFTHMPPSSGTVLRLRVGVQGVHPQPLLAYRFVTLVRQIPPEIIARHPLVSGNTASGVIH